MEPLKSNPELPPTGLLALVSLCPLSIATKLITPKFSNLKWQTSVISESWLFF